MSQDLLEDQTKDAVACEVFWNKHFITLGKLPVAISEEAVSELRTNSVAVEALLDYVVGKGYMLHGSRVDIPFDDRVKSSDGRLYATNLGMISLYKAIFSNRKAAGLACPYFVSETNPMILKIRRCNPNTVGENGFVCVVAADPRFTNDPPGSWQYYIEGDVDLPILAKIPVRREDFVYPVEVVEYVE